MKIHIITLFPDLIDAYARESILGRAQQKKILSITSHQIRDFVNNKWGKVDERPYGGGPGMVLQAMPILKAAAHIQKKAKGKTKILIPSPAGVQLTNAYGKSLTRYDNLIIICGRYEGIDARVKKILKAEEVSVGPYVLTGGELPALAIADVIARQIPGVLGKFESLEENRIASSEIYSRPEVLTYKGKKYRVPKVLLSGHHGNIDAWKQKKKKH